MKPEPLKKIPTRRYICSNGFQHNEEVVDVPDIRNRIKSAVEWLNDKDEIAIVAFIRLLKDEDLIEEFQKFRTQLNNNKHKAFEDVNVSK